MDTDGSGTTLFIRHLPSELSDADHDELLQKFGAQNVKLCGRAGPLKFAAFAKFANEACAEKALKQLHQLKILNRRLSVAYAQKREVFDDADAPAQKPKKAPDRIQKSVEKQSSVQPNLKGLNAKLDSVCSTWGVNYPMHPKLKYSYPPPSVNILTNIAHALATVPKFYVQVLHLMNRFNLPAPFGLVTPTPPLSENLPPATTKPTGVELEMPAGEIEEAEMAIESSSEESELESSNDEQTPKTDIVQKPKRKSKVNTTRPIKRPRLLKPQQTGVVKPSTKPDLKVDEIFEQPSSNVIKKIEIKQVMNTPLDNQASNPLAIGVNRLLSGVAPALIHTISATVIDNEPLNIAKSVGTSTLPTEIPKDLLSLVETEEKKEAEGFGKIEPQPKLFEEEDEECLEEEEWGAGQFISSRRLRRGQLSSREMRELNVFRKYDPGEPSSRLYIKNIAKQTTEKDLHYIFGRYVDWENELEKNMFDIRLMKEGRMKGQAFVTLASTNQAKSALKETNAFELNGKPLVVNFARSAKAKEDPKSIDKQEEKV